MSRAPRFSALVLTFGAALLLASCGARGSAPPEAGYHTGSVPELRGQQVMIFPVQLRRGGHAEMDDEISFALRARAPAVFWIGSDELRQALDRSPEVRIALDQLPVHAFLAGELQRVGDPLFGELYRIGALMNARMALLPVEVRERETEDGMAVELVAALVDTRTGRVAWFGVVDGEPGPSGSLQASAATAERLARYIVP